MAVTLHTDVGDIKIELFCEQSPKSCENFLALAASDYYKGNVFHRVIDGLDTLDELEKLPVEERSYKQLSDVRVSDITIHANPFAD